MKLYLDKLSEDQEVTAYFEEEENAVVFEYWTRDTTALKHLRQAADILGYNEIETDELTYAAHRISLMSSIRKALRME